VEMLSELLHRPPDYGPQLLGVQVFRQRIDRQHLWRVRFLRVQRAYARIVHLPVPTVPARLAGDRHPLPETKAIRNVRLVEPDALEAILAAVAEHDADDGHALVGFAPFHLDNLAVHGLHAGRIELRDGPNVAQIFVGAREVKQEVADGFDAEALEKFE